MKERNCFEKVCWNLSHNQISPPNSWAGATLFFQIAGLKHQEILLN
jgi:hypothetical protein